MKRSVWIIEYYSTLDRKGTWTHATIWMELENMKWSKPVTGGSILYHSTYRRWLLFSCSVMSNFFRTHGLQQARLPCPSLSPGVCSNSSTESVMPSNHLILCHPLLLLPSIFPRIRVFSNSWFFPPGGQRIGVSASASVLPMNIQDWFPLGRTDWIYLQSKGLSRVFANTTVQKHQFFGTQLSL